MERVDIMYGRCVPEVWFDGSVNSDVYIDQALKSTEGQRQET